MHKSPLDKIKVASPCNMEWRWMSGNDRVRYCRQCNLNVYNLSAMSRWEAEDMIRRTEGRLCVRFYRRADGTIITENCPVGLRAVKKRLARLRTHIFGAIISFLSFFSFFSSYKLATWRQEPVMGTIAVTGVTFPQEFMGDIWEPTILQKSESFIREKARYKVTPIYHAEGARRITGEAVVKVMVSADGTVETAEFVNGNPLFKELVEEAARRWQFEPMIIDGMPAKVESKLTFHFDR